MYDFDEVIDRAGTNSLKWDFSRRIHPELPEDYIPMWVADMEFACPQPVLDAMKARLDRRILGYSSITDPAYFETVRGWMQRRYGWDTAGKQIVFSPGVVNSLYLAVELLTKPGEKVLLNTPAYHPFDDAVKSQGRTPVYSPLVREHGRYTFDLADFRAKAIDPEVRLFFLCNPHNPTGRVWTETELRAVADICFENGVFIVSDEIHADFRRAGKTHLPLAKLYPHEKRIVTCTAPSKTFNLAGNQLSNIIFEDEALAKTWKHSREMGMPNPLSIEACKAAYTACDDWVDALNRYIDGNFELLRDRLAAGLPKARLNDSEGTYLGWLDLSGCGYPLAELQKRVFAAGLFIEYEDEFVGNAAGFVRINLACPRATVARAAEMLVRALS